jgi:hypothetical protein
MAFIPQWIKNTSAFRPRSILSPDDYLDCSLQGDRLTDTLEFAISSPRNLGKLGAKRKEERTDEQPKDF